MASQSAFVTHPFKQRMLLVTIFLLTTIEFLQAGMFAFAASPIEGETGTSPEEFSFMTAAYACVAIIMIANQRWIVERTGWRLYVWCSLLVFITGALICAESDTYHALLTGRVIMAIGGASFMTGARVLGNILPPSPLRFSGIKAFVSGLAAGTAIAPFLASEMVTNYTWAGIFYSLIAVAIMTFITASFALPTETTAEDNKTQSHPFLLMWLAGGAFTLLWAFQRSNYDFYSDALILGIIAVTALSALIYFFNSMVRFDGSPLLKVNELFRNPRYMAGLALFSLCYLVLGINNYLIPNVLQTGMGFNWNTVGHWNALGLSAALAAWVVMSKIMPKRPASKKFFITGFLSLAAYGAIMYHLPPTADIATDIIPALLCNGIFIMLVMATTAMHTFREVQHNETVFSHAQQVKNMSAQLFMALGTTLATVGMQWRITVHYGVLNTHVVVADPRYQLVLQKVSALYERHVSAASANNMALSWISTAVKQQATLLAGMDFYLVITLTGLGGALVMAFQKLMK